MKLIYHLLLVLIIFACGCSSNKFIKLEDDPACKTVFSGNLVNTPIWDSYFPAIVLKNGYLKRTLSYKMKEDGVDFIEKKSGIFSSIDTVFYPFSEILTIIDTNKNCIYGSMPKTFLAKDLFVRIHLHYIGNEPDYWPTYIEMKAGESFSYCVKPGIYLVTKIQFFREKDEDQSLRLPYIELVAQPNSIHNTVSFNITPCDIPVKSQSKNIFYVPYKIISRTTETAVAGLLGGETGQDIIKDLREKNNDIAGYYKIEIKYDEK